jgi:hypothetical protein
MAAPQQFKDVVTVPAAAPKEEAMSMMMREEYDKALDALSKEWATFGDRLVDRGYPSHLVWLSMLMFVFEVLVHQKGNDSAWQDIKQLADDYFGGFRPKRRLLFGAETIH